MAQDHRQLKAANGFVWLWILLTFIWFAANSSLAPEVHRHRRVDFGGAGLLAYPQVRAWRDIRFSPARLYHFILYTGVFIVELVRANINMMRYVYSPRIDINPGIVKIKTRLKIAGRPARACELHRADARFACDRYRRRHALHSLARRADHRSGRGHAADRRRLRGAPGESLWLTSSSWSPRF